MKIIKSKYFKYLIILTFIVVAIIFISFYYKNKYYGRNIIQKNVIYDKSSKQVSSNFINKKDLKIELVNYYNSSKEDEKEISFDIKFSKESGKLHSVIFDTLIYDDKHVVWNGIATSKYNYYRKYFFRDTFNKRNWLNIQDIVMDAGPYEILNNSAEDYSYLLYRINIGLKEEYKTENIYINLINLKYQDYGDSKYQELGNTDIKFNIEIINETLEK